MKYLEIFEEHIDKFKLGVHGEFTGICPFHNDTRPSFSGNCETGLFLCHACGEKGNIEKFKSLLSLPNDCTIASTIECNLKNLAEVKGLDAEKLESYGWHERKFTKKNRINIPYYDQNSEEIARRYRNQIEGKNKFSWKKGSKINLYGLDRLPDPKNQHHIFLVEGETDTVTMWQHNLPALGLPGANTFKDSFEEVLNRYDEIFVVIEPDTGGKALLERLKKTKLIDKIKIVQLSGAKDINEFYLQDRESFVFRLDEDLKKSRSLRQIIEDEDCEERERCYELAKDIIEDKDIINRFFSDIKKIGYVGNPVPIYLLFLALSSRILEKPISLIIKGTSSAGKSYSIECVLKFFPKSAYYDISSMSEKALIYSHEPIKHRFIILFESIGLGNDFATYIMRTLLSEHCIKYETVITTPLGPQPKQIYKEGPTGFISSTAAINTHPENETRLISVEIEDSIEQTKKILFSLADENKSKENVDYEKWHAFQDWLSYSKYKITIPYAKVLASMVPPVATRLRRDFGQFLNLIKVHALIHQQNREKDSSGQIIATIRDYEAIYEIANDLFSHTLEQTVSNTIRETVEAVEELSENEYSSVSIKELASYLKLDQSTTRRRVYSAIGRGYLSRDEYFRKKILVSIDDPLPEDAKLFPEPHELEAAIQNDTDIKGSNN